MSVSVIQQLRALLAAKEPKWNARAGEVIQGNLARGADGRFTSAGNASATPPKTTTRINYNTRRLGKGKKPKGRKAKGGKKAAVKKTPVKKTPEQNRADVIQQMMDQDIGVSKTGADALDALSKGGSIPEATAKSLIAMGLAEAGRDGKVRLTASGRAANSAISSGNLSKAVEAIGKGADKKGAAQDKIAQADQKKQEAARAKLAKIVEAEKKKAEREQSKKGGGGKGGKGGDKKQESALDKMETARADKLDTAKKVSSRVGLQSQDVDDLLGAIEGTASGSSDKLVKLGLTTEGENGPEATDAGRRAYSALTRGDVGGYRAALQDVETARKKAEARDQAKADREQKRQDKQAERDAARQAKEEERQAKQAEREAKRAEREARFAERAVTKIKTIIRLKQTCAVSIETMTSDNSGVMVYKMANGDYRWIALTGNAYEDGDKEVIGVAAFKEAQRLQQQYALKHGKEKTFGPLRWWHMGSVLFDDPLDWSTSYAGPGIDLGTADFSALVGRFWVESGTFKSRRIAEIIMKAAPILRVSLGFSKPADEPDAEGVYHHIKPFERSLLPKGFESNPYTYVAVVRQ